MPAATRPVLSSFLRTPFVAATPVDGAPVRDIIPRQVQVAFRGGGRLSQRDLVPLTPAARELLYGPDRDAARRVLRGMLATLDGQEGATTLRGISLSTDAAGFATNMMMSNVESGYTADSARARRPAQFEADFTKVARDTTKARAQNAGWIDIGPEVSQRLLGVIRHGPSAGTAAAEQSALVLAHELQHSVTAPNPKGIDGRLQWLEEGSAEALAWWPGTATSMMRRMGVPARDGWNPDPYTALPGSTASPQYRQFHGSVLGLLGLAGVAMYDDAGRPSERGRQRAMQLLQGGPVEGVPRDLARAIVRHNRLSPADVEPLRELIVESAGKRDNVAQIDALVRDLASRA